MDDRPRIFEVIPEILFVACGPVDANLGALGFGCLVALSEGSPALERGCEIRWRGDVLDGPVTVLADVAYAHLLEGRRVLVWSAHEGRVPAAWLATLMAQRWLGCRVVEALALVRAATGGDPQGSEWESVALGFDL